MNERDLDLALDRLGAQHVRRTAPPALRARVLAVPTETPQRRLWLPHIDTGGFTMFSALKFVAAAAIVALFGGFLLAGVLTTQQGDEVLPAAVTESPAPEVTGEPTEAPATSVRTDILPGVELTVEAVEPGVFRVVSDGVRDLARPIPGSGSNWSIVAGQDGSVWRLGPEDSRYGRFKPSSIASQYPGLLRLGDERVPPLDDAYSPRYTGDVEVGRDGTLWMASDGVWTLDMDRKPPAGREWESLGDGVFMAVALDPRNPSETVWIIGELLESAVLARHFVDGFEPEGIDPGNLGSVEVPWPVSRVGGLWVTQDGDVWLSHDRAVVSRFDGSAWQRYEVPGSEGGRGYDEGRNIDVGLDGTLWADSCERCSGLVRFDGTDWMAYDETDGVPDRGGYDLREVLRVAPDGSVWVNSVPLEDQRFVEEGREVEACGGLHNFDGTTWTQYLQGVCVLGMDVASDGTVWLQGASLDLSAEEWSRSAPVEVYVITPEAVAATE